MKDYFHVSLGAKTQVITQCTRMKKHNVARMMSEWEKYFLWCGTSSGTSGISQHAVCCKYVIFLLTFVRVIKQQIIHFLGT